MMELQATDDTRDASKVGMPINTSPTTVLDMSSNPGGTGNWNQPTGPAPEKSPINPGLRGDDADDDNE